MCDALSRNLPKPLTVVLAHCLAHARRKVVEATPSFPAECRHILETLRDVYRCDEEARTAGLSPADRLAAHQARSQPLLADLHAWLTDQIDAHRIEPNSGLGQAIAYLRKHWMPLTLFLRVAGAPLDNNVCERALKKAILHRKNALFYRTAAGAQVGDLFMSLIHTCELAGANPFDYLTGLQRHREALAATRVWRHGPRGSLPDHPREPVHGGAGREGRRRRPRPPRGRRGPAPVARGVERSG